MKYVLSKLFILLLLLLTFLTTNVFARTHTDVPLADFKNVLSERGLSISTKSLLGWARVLRNNDRIKLYNLDDLSKADIQMYVNSLKSKHEQTKFDGRLKN